MKFEKEVTIEVDSTLEELQKVLEENNFEIKEEYDVNDIYMIPKNYDSTEDVLELLKKCILLRDIIEEAKERKRITYKYKEYNDKKEIVKQGKLDCEITSIEEAKALFEVLNYEEYITINDHLIVYSNGKDDLCVQLVNDKHIYIEIEDNCHYADHYYETLEEMKGVFKKYNIPMKGDNYFVKKAEVEIKERYYNE